MDRFYSKTERIENGCLVWTAGKVGGKYGRFRDAGKLHLAHRWAYAHHNGEIPEGYEIDHICKNTSCVEITHLQALPQKQHRTKDLSGEGHGNSKLTWDDVQVIRASGLSSYQLAKVYNVNSRQIRRIRQGVRWNASREN